MRVCLFLTLLIPVTSYNWFDDFGSDEEEVTPSKLRGTTSPIPTPSTPTTTASSTTTTTSTTASSSTTTTTTKMTPTRAGPSSDVLFKTLLHGLFARLEKIEEEVSDLHDGLNINQAEVRQFNGNFSVEIGRLNEQMDSLKEMAANASNNHANLKQRLHDISNHTDMIEKRLSKDMDDLFKRIMEEVGNIDHKIDKSLNMTDEIVEVDGDVKLLSKQLKKIETLSKKILRFVSETESPDAVKSQWEEPSEKFIIVFTASITAAAILSAIVSGITVFCTYRSCSRRQGNRLSHEEIQMRALRYGQQQRPEILHPHLQPAQQQPQPQGQDVSRVQAFVDDIARMRANNESIDSDPNNIDRVEHEYQVVPQREQPAPDSSPPPRRSYVSPLRRLLESSSRANARIEANAENRQAFFRAAPPPYSPPPPPPINPPMPDDPRPINPPDLGLSHRQ